MRAARAVLALVAVSGIGLASAASAASAGTGPSSLTFSDAKGDNVSPSAGQDITGVTFTTSGSRTGRSYVAKNLVITMTLAGSPTTDGSTLYGIDTQLSGCGHLYLNFTPGAKLGDSFDYAECDGDPSSPTGGGVSFDAVPDIKGSTIVWTIPFKSMPGSVKVGSVFSSLSALTDFVDPVTGIFGSYGSGGPALYDTAATDAAYKVG